MVKKGPPLSKKSYWGKLIQEVKNQSEQDATFYFLPRKVNKHSAQKSSNLPNPVLFNQNIMPVVKRYQLSEPFNHIYLTQREIESVKAISHEKTIIEAANSLKLSPRTVEFYFNNVKKKLNCKKKREVLRIIKQYNLLD